MAAAVIMALALPAVGPVHAQAADKDKKKPASGAKTASDDPADEDDLIPLDEDYGDEDEGSDGLDEEDEDIDEPDEALDEAPEDDPADKPLKIVDIKVKGNLRVSKSDILMTLKNKKGLFYSAERIKEDIYALHDLGLFGDIIVEREPREDGWLLIFTVVENPSIKEIHLKGNKKIKDSKIEEVMDIKGGQVLNIPTVRDNVTKIKELYLEKGYFVAEVDWKIEEVKKHQVNLVFTITEHEKVKIRQIGFSGNKALADKELRKIMQTQQENMFSFIGEAGTFKPDDLEHDLLMITAYYYDKGYLAAKVGEPIIEFSPDHGSIDITIPITEGERFKIGATKVIEYDEEGNEIDPLGGRKKVKGLVKAKSGEWFSRSVVGLDLERIMGHYKNRGYANVNVDPKWKIRGETGETPIVDLIYYIQRGAIAYIGKILITGNEKTRDKVIRREVLIDEGDMYNHALIEVSKARVTALGYFESVEMSTKQGEDPDKIDIIFEVKERPTGTFQVGAGLSSVENFIFTAQISQENFLGRGWSMSLMAQLSQLRQLFNLSFHEPYFLDSKWFFSINVYSTMWDYWDFRKRAYGGRFYFGYPILPDLRISIGYGLEYVNVITQKTLSLLGTRTSGVFQQLPLANLFNDGWNSAVTGRVSYDTRNNRLFPSKGTYNSASVEWASPYLGSQTDFMRFTIVSRWYFPLGKGFVLKFNGEFGYVASTKPEGVPIQERYFLGGIYDVRGYRPRTLGPRLSLPSSLDPNAAPDPKGVNIGGNMMVLLQAEIEFPIIESVGIRGVVFFDAGNSFNVESGYCQFSPTGHMAEFIDPCNENPAYLRTSAGLGFRWFSPIGPLRFEWGIPLQRFEWEESVVFEFTIGNPF
ncbi:MAG: outer membrane protein assembly factor BamA [Pseudomonadota bacterium]